MFSLLYIHMTVYSICFQRRALCTPVILKNHVLKYVNSGTDFGDDSKPPSAQEFRLFLITNFTSNRQLSLRP